MTTWLLRLCRTIPYSVIPSTILFVTAAALGVGSLLIAWLQVTVVTVDDQSQSLSGVLYVGALHTTVFLCAALSAFVLSIVGVCRIRVMAESKRLMSSLFLLGAFPNPNRLRV